MLIDRLKQETIEKLQVAQLQYPTLVALLMEELKNNKYLGSVKYTTIIDLNFFTNTKEPFNLFNPIEDQIMYIESLLDEFQHLTGIYGKYYMERMFVDYNGYKSVRAMNPYKDILEELSLLDNFVDRCF